MGVFADLTVVRIEVRLYWVMMGPESNERILTRDRKGHRQRGEGPVKMQ